MAEIPYLNSDDVKLLKEMAVAFRNGRLNPPSRTGEPPDDHQAQQSYVAIPTTADGIPALTNISSTPGERDVPGTAICDIYRISDNGTTGTPELIKIGKEVTVFNISTGVLTQTWISVHRDKFGKWIAASGAGGDSGIIRFSIWYMLPDPVDGLRACVGIILSKPCGGNPDYYGDPPGTGTGTGLQPYNLGTAVIVDALGCLFDEAFDVLPGRNGYATRLDAIDYYGTGTNEEDTGTGTPDTGPSSSECRYECISLCCR